MAIRTEIDDNLLYQDTILILESSGRHDYSPNGLKTLKIGVGACEEDNT